MILLSATRPDGAVAAGTSVELTPTNSPGTTHVVVITDNAPVKALRVDAGSYHLRAQLSGFRTPELTFYSAPGGRMHLTARMVPTEETSESLVIVDDQFGGAYRTVFRPEQQVAILPNSRTVWSLIETAHPFLIGDRIDGGGLWSAESTLIAGHGSSWSQTTFQLNGLDVTDPRAGGVPLFYPDLGVLDAVEVDEAALPAEAGGPGPLIVMIPSQPSGTWTGTTQATLAPSSSQGDQSGTSAPPIARLDSWADVSAVISGPLRGPRIGTLVSTRWTRGRRLERDAPDPVKGDVRSFYTHSRALLGPGNELRIIAAFDDITRPFAGRARFENRAIDERDRAIVLNSTWERIAGERLWSVIGGYQRFSTNPRVSPAARGGTIERLKDGPPLALADPARALHERWDARVTFAPPLRRWLGREHVARLGASIGAANVANVPVAQPPFRELLNGQPARVWDVAYIGNRSRWSALAASASLSDQIWLTRALVLNAGLRLDYDGGSADGGSNKIRWADLAPRFSMKWRPRSDGNLAITTGYSWYGHRLPLNYFAVGDPAGPAGYVSRWDDVDGDRRASEAELTRVAAVGACCAGGQPNTIDPGLRRPSTAEFSIGVEHSIASWRWRVTGIDRRERDLVALVNVGVTSQDFSVLYLPDPGVDIAGRAGFTLLPIYNRSVASFGRDRYTLTNPDSKASRYQGVEIGVDKVATKWYLSFGGTAYRAEGVGGSRGFRSSENDQGVLGETFMTPNAQTSAYGRLFFDRAYVIKVSGGYRAPRDVRLGLVARYQDGQPFSRMVIAEALNQGPDTVQAYPRGGQRFTFTLTLDARVEKEFRLKRHRLGAVLEAFNLLDTANEVEEDVVTGSSFRTSTALQPPRTIRVGVRFAF